MFCLLSSIPEPSKRKYGAKELAENRTDWLGRELEPGAQCGKIFR
jgi:hypothetical protein